MHPSKPEGLPYEKLELKSWYRSLTPDQAYLPSANLKGSHYEKHEFFCLPFSLLHLPFFIVLPFSLLNIFSHNIFLPGKR